MSSLGGPHLSRAQLQRRILYQVLGSLGMIPSMGKMFCPSDPKRPSGRLRSMPTLRYAEQHQTLVILDMLKSSYGETP